MGVRGLQTFLKENRQSLCRSVILDRDGAGARAAVPVVVDAWGVIYQLYLDALPWASGGEYLRFYRLTRRLVKAWRAAGLDPTFVFDGASPPEKHATQLERMQGHVSTARMFYTISAATRSGPSFSRGSAILPPFAAPTFARALASLDVPVKFVPRGEADGACVVLADELGGYVLGKDTDFVVLSAAASDRLKGYCPLDMLEWIEGTPDAENEADGGSFTTVTTKQRPGRRTSRLLPPTRYNNPTLVLATYATPALCRLLRLPASTFPLFSSLLGNDYTPANVPELLSAGVTKPSDRIHSVARALREQLDRPRSNDDNAAAELVFRVVRKLCTRPYVNDIELRELAEAIIDATMQYSLPGRDCCSVYPFCGELDIAGCSTSLSRISTPGGTPPEPSPVLKAYSSAQRAGLLNLVTHAWLYPDRVYLYPGLEDPAGPSTRASAAGTAVRYAAYAIADEALGGLRFPAVSGDELEELKQDKEARKLLGVDEAEEDGESVAESSASDAEEADTTLVASTPPRAVVEYLRQGSSNRVGPRRNDLTTLPASDVPASLKPLSERLGLYLEHLGSKTPLVEALPPRLQPLVAAVRLCVVQAAEADTTGSRRWLKSEVEAVLRAGIGSLTGWELLAADDDDDAFDDTENEYPTLTNRSAELVAQLTAAFTDAQVLAQALLLLPEHGVTHLLPYAFISGVALHTALAGVDPSPSTGWRWSAGARDRFKDAKDAVLDLGDDMFGFTRAPKSPPRPKAKGRRPPAANGRKVNGSGGGGGSRFDLLSSVDGL